MTDPLKNLAAQISQFTPVRPMGRVSRAEAGVVHVTGLTDQACLGDWVQINRKGDVPLKGEVVRLLDGALVALPDAAPIGVALDDRVSLLDAADIAPSAAWIGRIVDPSGMPLDGKPLLRGSQTRPLRADPPPAAQRRSLGARLETGMAALNTFLPIVKGQRVGLFAGSGVGKSTLLGHLARHVEADVVVIALIGERGREVGHFVDTVLGADGLARAVVVAATSDQSPLQRRQSAWTAMAVAEHFRDAGKSVLLLSDSITRFAEAHREVAVAAGEAPVLRGYPPSTSHLIMSLCERAGPGVAGQGDITAIFSVLVAGSDMDEPIADILRGVLDGHVVLDREIAERGRYPAIDVLRSVSRSLPAAATSSENQLLSDLRKLMGAFDRNAMMIRAGLYAQGTDPDVDQAIAIEHELESFLSRTDGQLCAESYRQLELILRRGRSQVRSPAPAHRPTAG